MLTGKSAAVWLLTGLLAFGGVGAGEVRAEDKAVAAVQTDAEEIRTEDMTAEQMDIEYERLSEEASACRQELAAKEEALKNGEASQIEVMELQERFREIQLKKMLLDQP